jgi:hypothetical protein
MELNLKKSGRKTITKSFSLSPKTAEFIDFYSNVENCTASSIIDELVAQFRTRNFPNYGVETFNNEF